MSSRSSRSSSSRRRRSPAPAGSTLCQLVTPLVVHTAQEINSVSSTGEILVISQTLVCSSNASSDVRRLMHHLAGKTPLLSIEMSELVIDRDNENSKHEVFVGSDAILIHHVSTINRGRDRNSLETDDRRTYRVLCQGDLLPEDRRDKQSNPRHLTIVTESAVKNCEEIEKSERVMLVFDAADKPARVLVPVYPKFVASSNDDDSTSFMESVTISNRSTISIYRKADISLDHVSSEKEIRTYSQKLSGENTVKRRKCSLRPGHSSCGNRLPNGGSYRCFRGDHELCTTCFEGRVSDIQIHNGRSYCAIPTCVEEVDLLDLLIVYQDDTDLKRELNSKVDEMIKSVGICSGSCYMTRCENATTRKYSSRPSAAMHHKNEESRINSSDGSTMSPIRIETRDGYRSANSAQGAEPLARSEPTRTPSRTRSKPDSPLDSPCSVCGEETE